VLKCGTPILELKQGGFYKGTEQLLWIPPSMLKKCSHGILTCDAISNRKLALQLGYFDNVTENRAISVRGYIVVVTCFFTKNFQVQIQIIGSSA
jgi:hypothetical protein